MDTPDKLAYLCSSVSWGGLEMNQLRNALWMKERGHNVLVFCVEGTPFHEQSVKKGLTVVLIQKHRKYYDFGAAKQLKKLLELHTVSHLIIRDNRDMSIGASVRFLMKGRLHFSYFMEMQLGVRKMNLLHTIRYRQLDLWSCPLHWLAEQVRTMTRMEPSKIRIIPSALDLEPFRKHIDREVCRQQLDLPADKIILGLIGRFDPQKGQVLLLKAFQQLNTDNVAVCLLGEPTKNEGEEYAHQITVIIQENGFQDTVFIRPFREDIATFYKAMDVVIMASKAETFGMVTVEALASGTPVIGSNAGGTPEILENGKLGYLFEPLNIESLREKLAEFIANPRKIDANQLQQATEQYNHNEVCKKVEQALGL